VGYRLCFEDEKIEVDGDKFDSVREGQFVAIHRTPKSKQILLIEDRGDSLKEAIMGMLQDGFSYDQIANNLKISVEFIREVEKGL